MVAGATAWEIEGSAKQQCEASRWDESGAKRTSTALLLGYGGYTDLGFSEIMNS